MLPQSQPERELKTNKDKVPPLLKAPRPDFIKSAESILLLRHTPPGVIIDEHMEVVYFNGVLEPYLGHPPNQPTFNIFRLVHNSLEFELRNALLKAKNLQTVVMKEDIPLLVNGERWLTTLEIIPLTDTAATHYLLLFQKKSQPYSFWKKIWKKLSKVQANIGNGQAKLRVKILEKEYEQLRENMRTLSEDQEATNEELQSANEELLSGNEELQTLNEELETSTEELQSTNEELTVVNQQLEDKQNQLQIALIYTEAIVATLREPLVVLNRDFNIEMANTAFYKKFHVNEQEIKGKSLFDIQGGHWKKPELESLLENVLPEKEAIMDYELRLDLPPYGLRNLLLNASEIVSEHQPNKLILFAIEDITERKQAAEKQKSLLDELRHVNQQLEQFVNVTSHDLQEPLRKILIFSERLRTKAKGQLTEETETYLQKIELSSKRMTELIKGLLKYSRLTDYEKLFEPTDLNECVKVALGDLEHVIEQKKADIQISDLPTIEVIPLQMNQLFYNLISNALKFSKKDILPKIGISSRKLSEKEVEIIIKDNGIGFDQKYEEQIFKAFQRLDQPLKQKGTGIGLALVKRVVENHRGMIHATSKEGEGTTFQVQLPVKQPD
jgi:two-component system CheB/CheR fusion protein